MKAYNDNQGREEREIGFNEDMQMKGLKERGMAGHDDDPTFGPNTRLTDARLWPERVESERTPPA